MAAAVIVVASGRGSHGGAIIGGAAPDGPDRVLVFSRTAGFRHASIPDGVAAIEALGKAGGFAVTATEDPAVFTDEGLGPYAAVCFLSTTGDVLDDGQQAAFERYIRSGGGFVGIHAAADTEYDWPWYGRLVGAYFAGHPAIQEATVLVTDRLHPATRGLPRRWPRTDEWYAYRASPRGTVHVLASLDETTYTGGNMAGDHPIAWCHEVDGGRSFYTGGGHTSESFDEPLFLEHLLGGILWAAGRLPGDAAATLDRAYEKVVLDEHVTDPMELDVCPDGRVVFVERGGVIKIWRPDTRATVTAGFIEVFSDLEDGLLGVAVDPGFADNGWIYVYYSPAGPEPVNVLSRLTLSGDEIVAGSEVVMLRVPTQRDECCHSGGSIAFDAGGNLYLSTGDNTSPFASSGYSPIDERPGRMPWDAQKSSASTGDLRGKILRIRPRPDGTYDIPPGNLFPPGGSQGRPEIYVMGCRNPFRISVDPATGAVFWGEVGPDASQPREDRGPAGHDEFNRALAAGNFGWPYFIADNLAYHDFDFHTRAAGPAFDPVAPVNDSPNRNGRRELPPARPAWIAYPYGASTVFPALGSGGRCAMAGPVYHFDPGTENPHRLPEHFDGTLFLYEWARDAIYAVSLDESAEPLAIDRFLPGMKLTRPHELELGPDGCLYLIEWGSGFGGGNRDARLARIEHYPGGRRPPLARAKADRTCGPLPLKVRFSSAGSASRASSGGLRYAWDFGGAGRIDARGADATTTYASPGRYRARLTVTDAHGAEAVATVPITAGNTQPVVTLIWPPDGGICGFGDEVAWNAHVEDPEDSSIDPGRIAVRPSLGHDTHAHPLHRQSGPAGAFVTLRDDGHGAEADLFTVLAVSYTDLGAPGAGPLAARHEVILQPRRKQAEHFARERGSRTEKSADPDGGGQVVILENHGDFATYAPVNLVNIDAATLRIGAGPAGGAIELRCGWPEGALAGRAEIEPQGMLRLAAGPHPIRVEYFERTGDAGLIMRAGGPGLPFGVARPEHLDGLAVAYYELDDPTQLPDFDAMEPYLATTIDAIDLPSTGGPFAGSGRADHVGAVFTGRFVAPEAGDYGFSIESDDGSRLFIDGALVIDNDGLHAMVEKAAAIRWLDIRIPITDPGGTHELFVVYRPTGNQPAELALNWIEFHGQGVASGRSDEATERRSGEVHDHDHDHDHGDHDHTHHHD